MEITDFNQLVSKCRIFENKHKEKMAGGSGGPMRPKSSIGKNKPYSESAQIRGDKSEVKEPSFQSEGNTIRCYRCGGNHLRRNCPQRQQTQSRSASESCHVCGKVGHLARNCWYAAKPAGSVSVNQSANRGSMMPPRSNNTNNTNRNTNNSTVAGPRVPARVFAMMGEETTASEDETTAIADRVRALRGKGKA